MQPETQTRRQREEELIQKVWTQAKADALHPGDLKDVLDALRFAHVREEAIRSVAAGSRTRECSYTADGYYKDGYGDILAIVEYK